MPTSSDDAYNHISITDKFVYMKQETPAYTASGTAFTITTSSYASRLSLVDIPYRRYMDEIIHFDNNNHYAPIEFDYILPAASILN